MKSLYVASASCAFILAAAYCSGASILAPRIRRSGESRVRRASQQQHASRSYIKTKDVKENLLDRINYNEELRIDLCLVVMSLMGCRLGL